MRLGVVSNRHVPSTLARLAGADLPLGDPVDLVEDACPDQALFDDEGQVGARYQTLTGSAAA